MSHGINESEMTILVTDDHFFNIKVVQGIIRKAGYQILTATSGLECLDLTRRLKPDLILLDIKMPHMSGLEVCRALKKDQATKEIPVIFVTADADVQTLQEAFESGGADYVRKPVNQIELLARIKSALTHQVLTKNLLREEKLTGILEMAGAICHELNQPMQAISGYAELIMMDVPEDSPFYGRVQKIKNQIDKMGSITRKLMKITRYETRWYLGQSRIIDLNKAVDD